MIAIYYALKDNIEVFLSEKISGKKKIRIDVRSDSRSTIEQLQGISRIRDKKLLVMFKRIMRLLLRNGLRIVFHYVQRNMNIAGVILDLQRRGFL
ncbi:MAG TPA: hypothetical protein VF220_08280 [Nitrososphaeraceae archaeon]